MRILDLDARVSSLVLATMAFLSVSAYAQQIPAMAKNADPAFEVATIRPSAPDDTNEGFHTHGHQISVENETVTSLITFAYAIHKKQIVDAPAWFDTEKYDIKGVPDVDGHPNLHQYQAMIRKLLTDRFKLTFSRQKRDLSIYTITVAKGGPKLVKSTGDPDGLDFDETGNGHGGQTTMKFTDSAMSDYALVMQYVLSRPVVDQTGLTGRYDFVLNFTRDDSPASEPNALPGIFTAVQEQLGLKLEPVKGPADVLVIERVERPSDN